MPKPKALAPPCQTSSSPISLRLAAGRGTRLVLSRMHQIIVESLDQIIALRQAGLAPNTRLVGHGRLLGVALWRQWETLSGLEPGRMILDCGDCPALAIRAMAAGVGAVGIDATPAVMQKLAALAHQSGTLLIKTRSQSPSMGGGRMEPTPGPTNGITF